MNFKALALTATVAGSTIFAGAPAQAFGFGNLIRSVGGAAGVGPITDVVGGAIHENEVRKTNRMLKDNARKAQLQQEKIDAQNRATEEAIQAEVARRMTAEREAIAEERARMAQPQTQQRTATDNSTTNGNANFGDIENDPRWQAMVAEYKSTLNALGISDTMDQSEMTPQQRIAFQRETKKLQNRAYEMLNQDTGIGDLMTLMYEDAINKKCQFAPDVAGCIRIERGNQAQVQKFMGGNWGGMLGAPQ